ncbi:phage tail spike protein [Levilactobacillus humaensis]|uniref:phage tail spike protein n=1 Tax=Levilactobacillus humaensis TaxID=2950375 RepID=UPI0021C47F24|nr:phage tail spike protein [Levilactobacillus humaensis]
MAMIQLYGRDERDFQGHNGRVLDAVTNDTVTWAVNSQYDLQFDYPLFAKHGLSIENEMIVTAPVPGYDDQAFRINSVEKSMGVLTVHAYHIFWDLMQNFVEDINIVGKNGDGAIAQLMTQTQFPHEFSYESTVGNTANARIVRMSVIAALIGTDDNTILSRWGGEYEWDNFHFNHVAKLGADRGVVFRNGKNLLGYKATSDLTDTVTRVMPEGYNGLFLPELYVDSPLIDNYSSPRIAKIEYSDIKAIDTTSVTADGDDTTDADALPMDQALDALRAAASREFSDNHIDQPGEQYELNVVMLEDTEEYKGRGIFSRVYPGDTATFIHDEDGLHVKARMTGYTWRPSTQEYLTQSYYSSAALRGGTDIEHKIDNIANQITVIDKTTVMKAANNSNTVGWSTDNPPTDVVGAKEGDLWYQQVGSHVIMWMWTDSAWKEVASDISGHDASSLVDGTFNAANVNVINLNGNSIVSRSISADKLVANSITANEIKAGSITADKIAAGSILVGLNGELDSMQLSRNAINMYTGGKLSLQILPDGMYVSNDLTGDNVGFIHANTYDGHSDVDGLTFDLLPHGDYMAWGHQQSSSSSTFDTVFTWLTSSAASKVGISAGFTFSDNVEFQKQITMYGDLVVPGVAAHIQFIPISFNDYTYASIGRDGGHVGMALGGNELYMLDHGMYSAYSHVRIVGTQLYGHTLCIPTSIGSSGSIKEWITVNLK